MVCVQEIKSANSDIGGLFIAAIDRVCLLEEDVAFDCEGVNLSRLGSI